MLNISENSVAHRINPRKYSSLRSFEDENETRRRPKRLLLIFVVVCVVLIFLPWTQNIQANGQVTSRHPSNRPQDLQSVISGRIEKWHVAEGDFIEKGDTLLTLSEVKDSYFDPDLLVRTREQIKAKKASRQSYREKAEALADQITALTEARKLKLSQAANKRRMSALKVEADSVTLIAQQNQDSIALNQYRRAQRLYEQGLYSQTDLENRRQKWQEARAKRISAERKLLSSRNGLLNAELEINNLAADFRQKISKARSERLSALSNQYTAEAEISKLKNQLANYQIRRGNYFVKAPQDGYFTQGINTGVGETIKEGTRIATIMPASLDLAVEMYVRPIDLPLLNKGQPVRIQFDGWPAVFFSGWPGVSFGTFGGRIVAIDRFASRQGKFRVLVSPDPADQPWPEALRVGGGALTFTLLKDVPIWYEVWRQINGFPPEFYQFDKQSMPSGNKKAKK